MSFRLWGGSSPAAASLDSVQQSTWDALLGEGLRGLRIYELYVPGALPTLFPTAPVVPPALEYLSFQDCGASGTVPTEWARAPALRAF